ncbi:hypothetical protein AAFF_G00227450 [Aldrovandia affinis]|uniref:Alkylated DNA repair protein AlkB homologue 8 N-terminal domain-containing protein n=1 Tax=Aldrovandia affinis TaxID=143900 RepID=A0AAD7TBH4_9TELE|nr:hypothetical protein AAFF_G00227450 [Aldrovandia affinis]
MGSSLSFNINTQLIQKKGQQGMYLLCKLRQPRINSEILTTFYTCRIESVLTFPFLAWYGGLSQSNKNILRRIINLGSKLCGQPCRGLQGLYDSRATNKAKQFIRDPTCTLAQFLELLPLQR